MLRDATDAGYGTIARFCSAFSCPLESANSNTIQF